MSSSWYNKRYRTPDVEVQRINNMLQKQALERAQQERPTSTVELISVQEESFAGFYDRFKAKRWAAEDMVDFKFAEEPDGNILRLGIDFNSGITVDDYAQFSNQIDIIGAPEKADGLEDGGILHVPLDLKFNGKSDYVRVKDSPHIRFKEIMSNPPPDVNGFTIVFRISPLLLDADFDKYIYSKFDDNQLRFGIQIKLKPNGDIHFFVKKNDVLYRKYAANPFVLIPPPAGNYYLSNYQAENFMVVEANGIVDSEYIFFFQFRFSDGETRILRGPGIDITTGNSTDTMLQPVPLPDVPPPTEEPPPEQEFEVPVFASFASGEDPSHGQLLAYDGSLATYWMHSNRTAMLIADLGVSQRIVALHIAWYLGTSRRYRFDIYSGNTPDINMMTRLTPNTISSSGLTNEREIYRFPTEQFARYVGIFAEGHISTTPPAAPPVATWLTGMTATAEGHEVIIFPPIARVPQNAVDQNLGTRWAFKKKGTWIKVDLGAVKVVHKIMIAWYHANKRRYRYNCEASLDGITWTKIAPRSGDLNLQSDRQPFDKDYDNVSIEIPRSARYLRFNIWGNTTNIWANIWDIKVKANDPGGVGTTQSQVGVTEFDVWGFPSRTEQEPFVVLYSNPITAPDTPEFYQKLHAPTKGTTYISLYLVILHAVARFLGALFNRIARGQFIFADINNQLYGEIISAVSCYVRRVGAPGGYIRAIIRARSDNSIRLDYGNPIDVNTIGPSPNWTELTWIKPNNNYRMGIGDIIAFEYNGGNENNYLEIASTTPKVTANGYEVYYSPSDNRWHDNDQYDFDMKCFTGAINPGVSTTLVAQEILQPTSPMYSQVITKFVFYLRRKGTVTGNVNFYVMNSNNQIVNTLGSVAASSITNAAGQLTTITIDYSPLAASPMLIGYKIAVEYTAGNPDNCIEVRLFNDNSTSSGLARRNSNDIWSIDLGKDLAGVFYKGGKVKVIATDPIPPTPPTQAVDNYSHDLFLFTAGEENVRDKRMILPLQGFYDGKANKMRIYRKFLTVQEMTNWNTNKMSISPIAYGKVYTPLTLISTGANGYTLLTSSGTSGTIGASTLVQYWAVANSEISSGSTLITRRYVKYETPGRFGNLFIKVTLNTTDVEGSFAVNINGVDTECKVFIPSGEIGNFRNDVNSVHVREGDTVTYRWKPGSTVGNITFSIMSVSFLPDITYLSTMHYHGTQNVAYDNANTSCFMLPGCEGTDNITTESFAQMRILKPTKIKHLGINVESNLRVSETVIRSRLNGSYGNLIIKVPPLTSGYFEDLQHFDEASLGDLYSVELKTQDAGTQALTGRGIDLELQTANAGILIAGQNFGWAHAAGTTLFYPIGGDNISWVNEADAQMPARVACRLSNLSVNNTANTLGAPITITLRKNGLDTLTVVVPSNTNGHTYNDIDTVDLQPTDLICFKVSTGGTSGTYTLRSIQVAINYPLLVKMVRQTVSFTALSFSATSFTV
jgi:hypothetical protein